MGALHTAVTSGKALYAGISNYSPAQTRVAQQVLADLGTPLLIHQPSYSMFNRHIENVADGQTESLLDVVGDLGIGTIVFSPLAQGLLTGRYLSGDVPADSRAAVGHFLKPTALSETYLSRARALNEIAAGRGQSLAQLALSWVLRDDRITSALVGASSVAQLEDNVKALSAPPLTAGRDRRRSTPTRSTARAADRPVLAPPEHARHLRTRADDEIVSLRRDRQLQLTISSRTHDLVAASRRLRLARSGVAAWRTAGCQVAGRWCASHVSWRAVWWASPPSWWLYG